MPVIIRATEPCYSLLDFPNIQEIADEIMGTLNLENKVQTPEKGKRTP